ncbi:MAG: Sulfate transport system permease protein [Schlesneria sp.]|nr:Sulfate transport system permease protein [Schlesneria sp.]
MHPSSLRTKKTAGRFVADEPLWLRILLITAVYLIIGLLILVPMAYVFWQAMAEGWEGLVKNLWKDPDTLHSMWLTMTLAPLTVVLNTIFGLAAAWTITKFKFPGRTLLVTLLDVPFAISPVVVGLMLVLLFGMQGFLGPTLREWGIKVIFAWPGLLLATMFVTLPFVARELIPLMESLGDEEETAAVSLGANPWQLFWRITLPNIKWGLVYGMIQCHARAIGEFGAVYVVSGHIAGETDTMPLRVEKLFQEYNNPGSFAVASVLTLMALATLFGKYLLEQYIARQMATDAVE